MRVSQLLLPPSLPPSLSPWTHFGHSNKPLNIKTLANISAAWLYEADWSFMLPLPTWRQLLPLLLLGRYWILSLVSRKPASHYHCMTQGSESTLQGNSKYYFASVEAYNHLSPTPDHLSPDHLSPASGADQLFKCTIFSPKNYKRS